MSPWTNDESRRFEFGYEVTLPPGGKRGAPGVRAWLPAPRVNAVQHIEAESIDAPVEAEPVLDRELENRGHVFDVPSAPEPMTIARSWTVFRSVRRGPRAPSEAKGRDYAPGERERPEVARFLKPGSDVPIDGFIAERARAAVDEKKTPLEKARACFEHLLETLSYDSGGCTPERMKELGDLGRACDANTGTCTEWHGLYVGYLRSLGVPARFCFGFNIPTAKQEGTIAGYHCWSEVYLPGAGWLSVDVSEAYKHPDNRDFYFGNLDCNRVEFVLDRELWLDPAPATGRVDKWIFGHGERGGAEVPLGQLAFWFRAL